MMESAPATGSITGAESFECNLCGAVFTKEIRFEIHCNTKRHKSNVRKKRKDYRTHGFGYMSSLSQQINGDPYTYSDYKGSRQTFWKKRNTRLPETLISYMVAAVTHWSVDLALNPTINDFKISLQEDNKKFGSFGHAVVEISFVELEEKASYSVLTLVHFQNIESTITRTINSFKEGPFSYENILRKIGENNIKYEPNQNINYYVYSTCQPVSDLNTSIIVKFCRNCRTAKVICGCQVGVDEDLVSVIGSYLKKERLTLLNTSDYNENIYHFYNYSATYSLPNIYVYFNQRRRKEFLEHTTSLIAKQLCKSNAEQVAEGYTLYVSEWNLEKNMLYKLMKEDVLARLAGLLLKPFRLKPPSLERTFATSIEKLKLWVRATRSVDVTVLRSQRDLSKLIKPYNLILGKLLEVEIDEMVKLKPTTLKNMSNHVLKSYLYEADQGGESFQLELLQEIGWRAGLVPLTLQAEDPKRVGEVVEILENFKKQGFFRRYILVTNYAQNVRTHQKYLSTFLSLVDVSDKLDDSSLEEVKIEFAGEHISLQTIDQTDPLFKKIVTPYEFFYMILGEAHMKLDTTSQERDVDNKLVLETQMFDKFMNLLHLNVDTERIALRGINPILFK